jgi:hypothetical protein
MLNTVFVNLTLSPKFFAVKKNVIFCLQQKVAAVIVSCAHIKPLQLSSTDSWQDAAALLVGRVETSDACRVKSRRLSDVNDRPQGVDGGRTQPQPGH